jgi:hypothetical protein
LTGSILGWADRKGASDCADEVILARKEAKSRRRVTGLRSKTTKARTRVASSGDSQAALIRKLKAHARDLEKELEARTHELAEAGDQQTATSEVLRVISSSPGELDPVFSGMLESALRICEAKFGMLHRYSDGAFVAMAIARSPAVRSRRTE